MIDILIIYHYKYNHYLCEIHGTSPNTPICGLQTIHPRKKKAPHKRGSFDPAIRPDRLSSLLLVNAQLVAPAWEDLVGIAREGLEGTSKLFVLLRELDGVGTLQPALVGLAQ
jgi:hypothetical protein